MHTHLPPTFVSNKQRLVCTNLHKTRVTTITHRCSIKHIIEHCPKHGTYQKQIHTHTHIRLHDQRTVRVEHIVYDRFKPVKYNTQNMKSYYIIFYWITRELNIIVYFREHYNTLCSKNKGSISIQRDKT